MMNDWKDQHMVIDKTAGSAFMLSVNQHILLQYTQNAKIGNLFASEKKFDECKTKFYFLLCENGLKMQADDGRSVLVQQNQDEKLKAKAVPKRTSLLYLSTKAKEYVEIQENTIAVPFVE